MITIVDLPPDALASITTYLTKTSVGFFAAAMPPEASNVSEALVSSVDSQHWESIDFMDVTKNVRKKLTDKELAAFLCSIDAVGRVKSLKICHLLGIKGSGLKPLVGSSVLERLDLSTVSEDYFGSNGYGLAEFYSWEKDGKRLREGGYGAGEFDPHHLLSEEMVLPILDSILEQEDGHSIRYLRLPYKWIQQKRSAAFHQIVTKYTSTLNGLNIPCGKDECGATCRHEFSSDGIQIGTCYDCLEHTCDQNCKKYLCNDCANITKCDKCDAQYCSQCNGGNNTLALVRKCGEFACTSVHCRDCNPVDDCIACCRWMCGKCEELIYCERRDELVCEACYEDEMSLDSENFSDYSL